ncbi:MAG: hypothetical protein ABR910_07925 [Acidobacteriaceae bacterium]|jgi:hypothetical protein
MRARNDDLLGIEHHIQLAPRNREHLEILLQVIGSVRFAHMMNQQIV